MAENLWISFAFLTASIFATVSLFDKIVLDKRVYSTLAAAAISSIPMYLLFIGVGIVTGNTVLTPLLAQPDLLVPVIISILAGVVHAVSITANFFGLEVSDVSVFVPLVSSDVIFVAVLAFLLLGEEFPPLVYVGILVIFAGVFLLSLDFSRGISLGSLQTVWLALFVALLFGINDIMLKYLTTDFSMFEILFWFGIGGLITFCLYGEWRLLSSQTNKTAIRAFASGVATIGGALTMTRGVGLGIGFFTFTRALELGPVSLVVAVVKMQVLLVFFAAVVLTLLVPQVLSERTDKGILAQKFVASLLIVGGVVLIQALIA